MVAPRKTTQKKRSCSEYDNEFLFENELPVYNNRPSDPAVASASRTATYDRDDPALDETVADGLVRNNSRDTPVESNYHIMRSQVASIESIAAVREKKFVQALKKRGLEMVTQDGDGNCLFRAVSLQVYGDSNMHNEVRERCVDFMAKDKEHFGKFVVGESFEQYIARKRRDGVHGNNPEIQAIAELYNRPVEVFTPEDAGTPINIFHTDYDTFDTPIRLSYHDGNHYNAVIDPLVPTAGLGLGLPGLQPGLADKLQLAKAVAESDRIADDIELDRVLKESKNDHVNHALKKSVYDSDIFQSKMLAFSDADATNYDIEQAIIASTTDTRKQSAINTPLVKDDSMWYKSKDSTVATTSSPVAAAARSASIQPSDQSSATRDDTLQSTPNVARASSAATSISPIDSTSVARISTANEPSSTDEYPAVVEELVINGFELQKVIRAYELVGDNFDDLLMFLMSNSS